MCVAGVTGTLARGCRGNRQSLKEHVSTDFAIWLASPNWVSSSELQVDAYLIFSNEKQKGKWSSVEIIISQILKIAVTVVQKDLSTSLSFMFLWSMWFLTCLYLYSQFLFLFYMFSFNKTWKYVFMQFNNHYLWVGKIHYLINRKGSYLTVSTTIKLKGPHLQEKPSFFKDFSK